MTMNQQRGVRILACILAVCLLPGRLIAAEEEAALPDEYILDYPKAEKFCAPVRSTFYEATRDFSVVRGKRFRHQPNGGYGLPIVDKLDGKNLIHVGADLGWYQLGEPVFAIANGVVRVSTGPEFKPDDKPTKANSRDSSSMEWGNFVAIEHWLADDRYVTSLYGHLGTDRAVKAGEIVNAGQPIGTIGRQHLRINGGFKPHTHVGIRAGRIAEEGITLMRLVVNGRRDELVLVALGKEWSEVRVPADIQLPLRIDFNGGRYDVQLREGKTVVNSALLWHIDRPDFPLVGYSLSTEGWLDPVQFLREQHADTAPAPYRVR